MEKEITITDNFMFAGESVCVIRSLNPHNFRPKNCKAILVYSADEINQLAESNI